MSYYPSRYGLDFETYSDVDLPKRGAANYFASPEFAPLVAATFNSQTPGPFSGSHIFDFVLQENEAMEAFSNLVTHVQMTRDAHFIAHNASFEYQVLIEMGMPVHYLSLEDSAVIASANGAGRRLAQAAPQLGIGQKMEEGKELIKLFSIPNKRFDFKRPTKEAILSDPELVDKWNLFKTYCLVDAQLSFQIGDWYFLSPEENYNRAITEWINDWGWQVDTEALRYMQQRYEENVTMAELKFREQCNEPDLNLYSPMQLQAWCKARGINSKSFDEKTVAKLLPKLNKRLLSMPEDHPRFWDYTQVKHLLETKQVLGGSALKKLTTIEQQMTTEGKLKGQYLHLGASQTFRTTGRGVQMQNIKRLPPVLKDFSTLGDPSVEWTNEEMADNLRQLFTATNPDPERGQLVVGDFSSVESRGLAWLAQETWKLKEYRHGSDIYKVLAALQYQVPYEEVTKDQRKFGKVGELSCGYGAGPNAVRSFAEGMGVDLDETAALKIVRDWRAANTEIVEFWERLDRALHSVMQEPFLSTSLMVGPDGHDHSLWFVTSPEVGELAEMHPGCRRLTIELHNRSQPLFSRTFRGCYERGRNICYHKPTGRITGALWTPTYTDIKTKRLGYYDIYGGKLAGILTQSFCRELFFNSLMKVYEEFKNTKGVQIVGQFHDEIVLDVDLDETALSLIDIESILKDKMSEPGISGSGIPGFPLNAEVSSAWRYIK